MHAKTEGPSAGMTLVEVIFVVTIIGILAMVAMPKMGRLISKSREGATKANLNALRTVLRMYYADTEGLYPSDASSLATQGKYLSKIPETKLPPYHLANNAISAGLPSAVIDDSGGWVYNNVIGDGNYGSLWVNCTHTDMSGTLWSAY